MYMSANQKAVSLNLHRYNAGCTRLGPHQHVVPGLVGVYLMSTTGRAAHSKLTH